MIIKLVLAVAIAVTILIAYSMGKNEDNAKVNDMRSQLDTLKAQLGTQGKNIKESYDRLHRSLNLHMAETSIETAIHDTLDENFGEARIAVGSAKKYLQHSEGKEVSAGEISVLSGELDRAAHSLEALDRSAIKSLSAVEQRIRDLIAKNAG
jgi:gas vesicle protein